MSLSHQEIEQLYKSLKQKGESTVNQEIANGRYAEPRKAIVQQWLKERQEQKISQEKLEQRKMYQEELDIMRSGKNSSWLAAFVSIIAAIISIAAIFLKK